MAKFSRKQIIIFLFTAAAAAAIIVGIIFLTDKNQTGSFIEDLSEAESYIESGYYIRAFEQLDNLYNRIRNSRDALSFLKRCLKLAESSKDFTKLSSYSLKLYKKYPNNIEIAAICSYSYQKTGRYGNAAEISELKLDRTEYSSIHLLNVIKTGERISDRSIKKRIAPELQFIFSGETADAESLLAAAEKYYDPGFILDAALLYALDGRLEEAYEILRKTDGNKSYNLNEVKMYLAYDNSDFVSAEKYYNSIEHISTNNENIFLTGCDILLRIGKYNAAALQYRLYLENNPRSLSLPYRNLYAIERNNSEGFSWLLKGLEIFPESRELLISSAWEMYLENNRRVIDDMLAYFDEHGYDEASELFRINLMMDSRSPEHVIGNFWNIFNSNIHSENTAVAFANFLLENRQFDQLNILLDKYSRNNLHSDWIDCYAAVSSSLNGNAEDALKQIDAAIYSVKNTVNLYNRGVVQNYAGLYSDARKSFEQALRLEESGENNPEYLFKIYLKLSESNYNMDNYETAYHYIVRAMDIEPDSLKCSLMLNKIKEEL